MYDYINEHSFQYVSNYKSKLKKVVAGINADASGTGGGPPSRHYLSEEDNRFLGILGPGFGEGDPRVQINPFPDMVILLLITIIILLINLSKSRVPVIMLANHTFRRKVVPIWVGTTALHKKEPTAGKLSS